MKRALAMLLPMQMLDAVPIAKSPKNRTALAKAWLG